MSTAVVNAPSQWIWIVGIVYSSVILTTGLCVSVATGEWIALLCAVGLVVVPVGSVALRAGTARSHGR